MIFEHAVNLNNDLRTCRTKDESNSYIAEFILLLEQLDVPIEYIFYCLFAMEVPFLNLQNECLDMHKFDYYKHLNFLKDINYRFAFICATINYQNINDYTKFIGEYTDDQLRDCYSYVSTGYFDKMISSVNVYQLNGLRQIPVSFNKFLALFNNRDRPIGGPSRQMCNDITLITNSLRCLKIYSEVK